MAVDTQTKRRSALGMTIMALAIAPVPDGTVGAVDREHILGIYAGIAPGTPVVLATLINKIGTGVVNPNHAADLNANVVFGGDVEVQGDAYFGGLANYAKIDSGGDVLFVGAAGLAYGSMYTNADILVATVSNVWKEIDAAQAWTTGKVHNCTFADPKLTVTYAGTYQVTWHAAVNSSVANKHVEGGIMIDSTVTDGPAHGAAGVQSEGRDHVELLATEQSMSGGAILQLAAGKTISFAVRNVDAGTPNITVAHGNITAIQIAGASA